MPYWTFWDFVDGSGVNRIQEWVGNELTQQASVRFETILTYLAVTRIWTRPYYDSLTGFPGIGEIRFTVQSTQYRPLGFFGPGPGEFTLLTGAKEIGNQFRPRNAPAIAVRHMQLVLQDRRFIASHE